jgi:hypothetical protein
MLCEYFSSISFCQFHQHHSWSWASGEKRWMDPSAAPTSRKWVFGPPSKCHLSRFCWPMGTNDRPRSRFVPLWGRSRFISEHRSRFVASTGTNAPPPRVTRGALRSIGPGSCHEPGSKTLPPSLAINKPSPLPPNFAGLCVRCGC